MTTLIRRGFQHNRVLVVLVTITVVALLGASSLASIFAGQTSNGVRTLLLSGKTSSARRVKTLEREVQRLIVSQAIITNNQADLLYLVNYVKAAQTKGQGATAKAIALIDAHIDRTTHADAVKIEREVLRVLVPELRAAARTSR